MQDSKEQKEKKKKDICWNHRGPAGGRRKEDMELHKPPYPSPPPPTSPLHSLFV